jgi:AcrR family transcriptional regulator
MDVEPTGLRERKKAATRTALIQAAWRLAIEHGPARVRVEDIAAAAGVSTRTFNNYFASKEDALLALGADRAARVEAAVRARPANEPLWEALSNALTEQFSGAAEVPHQHAGLTTATPELAAAQQRLHQAVEPLIARAIADRLGMDVDRDLYPRLVAAAVLAATRVTFDHWRATTPDKPFPVLLKEVLAQFAVGLNPPRHSRKGRR